MENPVWMIILIPVGLEMKIANQQIIEVTSWTVIHKFKRISWKAGMKGGSTEMMRSSFTWLQNSQNYDKIVFLLAVPVWCNRTNLTWLS